MHPRACLWQKQGQDLLFVHKGHRSACGHCVSVCNSSPLSRKKLQATSHSRGAGRQQVGVCRLSRSQTGATRCGGDPSRLHPSLPHIGLSSEPSFLQAPRFTSATILQNVLQAPRSPQSPAQCLMLSGHSLHERVWNDECRQGECTCRGEQWCPGLGSRSSAGEYIQSRWLCPRGAYSERGQGDRCSWTWDCILDAVLLSRSLFRTKAAGSAGGRCSHWAILQELPSVEGSRLTHGNAPQGQLASSD